MLPLTTRLLMTNAAFAPLWLVIAVKQTFGAGLGSWLMFAMAAVGVLELAALRLIAKRHQQHRRKLERVSPKNEQVLAYFATYLLPLAADVDSTRASVAMAIFVAVMVALSVQANLLFMQPLLAITGHNLQEITVEGGSDAMLLITRRSSTKPRVALARKVAGIWWEDNP